MKKLYFLNDEFHNGVNFTVRLGKYWFHYLSLNEEIKINNMKAKITHLFCKKYGEIPNYIFKGEHDSNCQNYDGLDKAMKKAYHNKFIDNDLFRNQRYYNQIVTIIGFTIIGDKK